MCDHRFVGSGTPQEHMHSESTSDYEYRIYLRKFKFEKDFFVPDFLVAAQCVVICPIIFLFLFFCATSFLCRLFLLLTALFLFIARKTYFCVGAIIREYQDFYYYFILLERVVLAA